MACNGGRNGVTKEGWLEEKLWKTMKESSYSRINNVYKIKEDYGHKGMILLVFSLVTCGHLCVFIAFKQYIL